MARQVLEAALIRRQMTVALETDTWYSTRISPNTASFILGLPVEVLKRKSFAVLIQSDSAQGLIVNAGSTRKIAMQAFLGWANGKDTVSKESFNRESYLVLYGIFQQAARGMGEDAFTESNELFVRAIISKVPSWKQYLDYARGGSIADQNDFDIIHKKMVKLWNRIPNSVRNKMNEYNPDNLFRYTF